MKSLFLDLEFPKGIVRKIMEIPGGRGSNAKPSGTENPVGWRIKLEKTLRGEGGVWILSGTTQSIVIEIETQA